MSENRLYASIEYSNIIKIIKIMKQIIELLKEILNLLK